jgi:hypothetical protein
LFGKSWMLFQQNTSLSLEVIQPRSWLMLFSQHAIWRFLHNVFRQHSIDEFLQPMWPYFPTWFVLSTYCVQRFFSQLHGRVDHWQRTWCSPMQQWKRHNSVKYFLPIIKTTTKNFMGVVVSWT